MRDFGVDKNVDCMVKFFILPQRGGKTKRIFSSHVNIDFDVPDSHNKCKENKENKNIKRKHSQKKFYLPRKSRRTEASKELKVSVNA